MNAVKNLTAPCVFVQARPMQLHGGRQRVDGAFYLPSARQLRRRAARSFRDKGAHQPVKAAGGKNNSPGRAAPASIIRSRSSRPRSPGVERVRGKMRGASAPGGRGVSQMSSPQSSARRLRRTLRCRRSKRIKALAPWSRESATPMGSSPAALEVRRRVRCGKIGLALHANDHAGSEPAFFDGFFSCAPPQWPPLPPRWGCRPQSAPRLGAHVARHAPRKMTSHTAP